MFFVTLYISHSLFPTCCYQRRNEQNALQVF